MMPSFLTLWVGSLGRELETQGSLLDLKRVGLIKNRRERLLIGLEAEEIGTFLKGLMSFGFNMPSYRLMMRKCHIRQLVKRIDILVNASILGSNTEMVRATCVNLDRLYAE